MTFDPTFVEVTCVTLPRYCCIQVPCKYIEVFCYSDQRPKGQWLHMTPKPLNPHQLNSHVRFNPRIMFNSHENTSKHVDAVGDIFFENFNQRSMTSKWPLSPLLLNSHVWLYYVQIPSWESINVCGYSDNFAQLTTYYMHILKHLQGLG